MEGEIVGQLMGQKGTIEIRDQDFVRMRDIEREGNAFLRLGQSAESKELLMDPARRNNEHLRTGFGDIRGNSHEAGDIEVDLVNRIWGDLAVTEVKDIGVESRPNPRSSEILNATEASLKEEGEQK